MKKNIIKYSIVVIVLSILMSPYYLPDSITTKTEGQPSKFTTFGFFIFHISVYSMLFGLGYTVIDLAEKAAKWLTSED